MNNDRFDLIIRAYYLTGIDGPYGSSNSFYGHRYRLVIRAGLNIKTNISTCQFEQQGEGQWPLEP